MNMKDVKGRTMAAAAVSGVLLLPLAVFGAPALARSGAAASASSAQYEYGSGSSQYQYRVTICHLTGSKKHPGHTITVSSHAVQAHLRHGDHLGACTGLETRKGKHGGKPAAKPAASTSTAHGNEHGKGHNGK
jgi:hypothetical protein